MTRRRVLDRLAEEVLAEVFLLLAVFLWVVDFFVVAEEWLGCPEEVADDCAASRDTERHSDNTPVRQSAAKRAKEIRGTTTIMFSLYADFAQSSDAGTTSVTTQKGKGTLAGQA